MSSVTNTIVITGATSGIGRAVARKFYHEGWNVFAMGRNQQRLESLGEELGEERLKLHQADLRERNAVQGAVLAAVEFADNIDVAFLGAGFGIGGKIGEKPMSAAEEMVQINLISPFYFLEAISPIFKKQGGGHLVGVGSVAGIKPAPGFALYSATKFALRALIEGWRNEIQEYGVKTTILQPGVVDTPFWEIFADGGDVLKFEKDFKLSASDVAELTYQIVDSPGHISINELTVRPTKQVR